MTGGLGGGGLVLALPLALLAGLVSFASPCVLPLVPGYLAYVGGTAEGRTSARASRGPRGGRGRVALGAALFVAGFTVVFVVAGFVVGTLGALVASRLDLVTRLAGVVVIVLGLVFLGRVTWAQRTLKPRVAPRIGLVGAPVLGAVFALGWSPCIGPTLGAIWALSLNGASAATGVLLAVVYSLGLGVPFIVVALGLGWATRSVGALRRHIRAINVVGGLALVAIGVLMVSGLWNAWVLELQGVIPDFVPIV